MASSTVRKTKRAAKTAEARAKRKAGRDGVELADAKEVRRAFLQVNEHIQGLVKVFRHNGGVIQTGFYKNDIWLETFKLLAGDSASMLVALGEALNIEPSVRMKDGEVDWKSYWNDAKKNIDVVMEQEAPEPQEMLIERPDDMEPLEVEFGGDYAVETEENDDAENESAEAGQVTA